MTTNGNFEQSYGYFEARVYLPGVDGQIANWPGFWTNGQNHPEDGEIDIVEGLDGDASWHYHYPDGAPGEHAEGDYTGWHTYGALWEPGKISFYYDNEFVGEITTGVTEFAALRAPAERSRRVGRPDHDPVRDAGGLGARVQHRSVRRRGYATSRLHGPRRRQE